MTPDEALTQLIKLTEKLPLKPRMEVLSLLRSLEVFHKKQEDNVEALYKNIVVLNAFLGANRPLN